MKSLDPQIIKFLDESNKIEGAYDKKYLDQAVKAWQYLEKQKELTIENILKTHEILSKGFLDKKDSGHFRKEPVWIGGHEAKPWYAVPDLIDHWIKWSKEPDLTESEIERLHVQFESIHPFIDGNGRIGRILMNWQRVKVGLPILIIEEAKKWEYYRWFQ